MPKTKLKTFREQRKAPCTVCPWRRDSGVGWLGGSSPERFVINALSSVHLPCHQTLNYDDKDVINKWERGDVGKLCAGTLAFLANNCILPRDPELRGPSLTRNEEVFTSPHDFIDHHRRFPRGSWSETEDATGLAAWRIYQKYHFVAPGLALLAHFDLTGELVEDVTELG